jgi:hypothetical protein
MPLICLISPISIGDSASLLLLGDLSGEATGRAIEGRLAVSAGIALRSPEWAIGLQGGCQAILDGMR